MPRLGASSTRARVLGWFMLIVTLALGLNIVVVGEYLHARAHATIRTELEHEVAKFRQYAARNADPDTGAPFADVGEFLRSYLAESVPDQHESLFSVVDGRAAHRTRGPAVVRLDRDPAVLTLARTATAPLIRTIPTSRGDAVVAVVPVDAGAAQPPAALVVAEFPSAAEADASRVVWVTASASAAALLVAGIVSWFVAGRILAPLRHVRATAETIGESDLSGRIRIAPGARDDVARLGRAFNRMLDRLESAFTHQRAFLDDAAHELRTPLTVIRGHMELMGEDPVERAETTALVLEEIHRMDRIVDDLFTLAAADHPDFLTLGEVDLTDLVVGVVARVQRLAPRAWSVEQAADAVVVADGQRLTQALVQLAANAVRFTGDGDPIGIGSALVDGQVQLTVRDRGPGVPDELKTAIFDRFTRGDERGNGTGLGLAIVASIAGAHGGTAYVADTPGGGATFVVAFPAQAPGGPDDPRTGRAGAAGGPR